MVAAAAAAAAAAAVVLVLLEYMDYKPVYEAAPHLPADRPRAPELVGMGELVEVAGLLGQM